ncbi:hypothetical protein LX77_00306 [Gelidibacter algens]|uniref:Uncharacterized protein n=1 Tax=Gelidibacter algens TaxID=49280 RepID=A0A1A7R3G1_9FLAO|nr:TIGR04086 family membrane protein [Gelidibacter algens]OBX26004.1 hypothetical protein A9996_06730 [Gelidibacter algens]RAJ27732.1 hypothetical protein LX77_00306 [Gelidibacter algens]
MKTPYTPYDTVTDKISRISWGAIIAGALTALAVVTMLNLLGLGIGLSTIDPMSANDTFKGLGTGTLIWLALSNLAALFVGGMVAGRMSGFPSQKDGGLHGFLAWALYAVISFLMITSAVGSMVNGVSSTISGVFGGSQNETVKVILDKANQKGEDQTSLSYDAIKRNIIQLVKKGEKYNVLPDDASENTTEVMNEAKQDATTAFNDLNLDQNIDAFFNDLSFDLDDNGDLDISVDGDKDFLNKEDIKNYLTENTGLTESEIDGMINKWDKKIETAADKAEMYYAQAKQKAIKYSDKAADAAATASIIAFVMFLLGALAACFGGATGSPVRTIGEEEREHDVH